MTYGIYYYCSCCLVLAILLMSLLWRWKRKPFMFGENLTFPSNRDYRTKPVDPPEGDTPDSELRPKQ